VCSTATEYRIDVCETKPSGWHRDHRLIREQFPPIHVVILSYSNLPQDLEAAIQAGASSYLIKGETGSTQIAAAIREANTLFSRFSFTTRS
jgi:DNA-binding NarL/FixJ family response regulator